MYAAPGQDNNRFQKENPRHPAHVANHTALARVMGNFHAASKKINLAHGSYPGQSKHTFLDSAIHDVVRGYKHPVVDKGHGFNPLDVAGQLARGVKEQFNPTTRAGAANIASMFAGGPKEPMDESLMARGYRPYNHESGSPLDRGIVHEGPRSGPGRGMRGIMRRAQGVGGYRRPNEGLSEMARLEALRREQSKLSQTRDSVKEYANRSGMRNREINTNMLMQHAYEQQTGGALIPYRGKSDQVPFMDMQPHEYTDRMKAINLYRDNPDLARAFGGSPQPMLQVLYDMLFSGKGFPQAPRRP